ncbi:Inner membrane ABC transporter permease protein YejE [Sodalis praecaptivus]
MKSLSPVNQARWARFRHNRRGYWSLWLFILLFVLSLGSELIANDRPLLVRYQGQFYWPLFHDYSEADFGGPLASRADYRDPWLERRLDEQGWALWAPVRFNYRTINYASPAIPSAAQRG